METSKPRNTAKQFRNKFSRSVRPLSTSNLESVEELESMPNFESAAESDTGLSESEIIDRIGYSKESLYKFIEKYLGNDPKMKALADKILKDAPDHMRAVANEDEEYMDRNREATSVLEVIVETDGSRPSFMIKNGDVDLDSSPVGDWGNIIVSAGEDLRRAIACTGRINKGNTHVGTGFLVHRNLIVTNRHVLQSIGRPKSDGSWELRPDANIDFGHEFEGIASLNRRKLATLIYTGAKTIDPYALDHNKLDLALIQLADADDANVPPHLFNWNKGVGWTWPKTDVFIIGYPGDPRRLNVPDYTPSLLDQLFQTQFGCKRLAPGKTMDRSPDDLEWMLKHDATTLGGNSGSVIVPLAYSLKASALHYGGDLGQPRENWGHILALVLEEKDAHNKALQEYLEKNNVVIENTDE